MRGTPCRDQRLMIGASGDSSPLRRFQEESQTQPQAYSVVLESIAVSDFATLSLNRDGAAVSATFGLRLSLVITAIACRAQAARSSPASGPAAKLAGTA
jgi:hypothetical protein